MNKLNQKQLVGWVLALAAINWGLVAVLGVDLVGGLGSGLSKIVYGVVGLVGVYKVYLLTMGGKK